MLDAAWPRNTAGVRVVGLCVTLSSLPQLSVLDLAPRLPDGDAGQPFRQSVELAQTAEAAGFAGLWYAEHHNMETIASSATAVLMAHVAAQTKHISVGSGGVMLSNHAPLIIAEQFGMLEAMHPGRVNLGVGRAPGTDQITTRALRRGPDAAEHFPSDVLELMGYLDDETRIPGVNAYPGRGSHVPVTILGSSLFGAQLAAQLGLPYAFASHFAPAALHQALDVYVREFKPSARLQAPKPIVAVGVVAAEDPAEAVRRFELAGRERVRAFLGRGREKPFTEDEVDMVLESPAGRQVLESLSFSAIGTPDRVSTQLQEMAATTGAAELITVHHAVDHTSRLESVRLLGAAWGQNGSNAHG